MIFACDRGWNWQTMLLFAIGWPLLPLGIVAGLTVVGFFFGVAWLCELQSIVIRMVKRGKRP